MTQIIVGGSLVVRGNSQKMSQYDPSRTRPAALNPTAEKRPEDEPEDEEAEEEESEEDEEVEEKAAEEAEEEEDEEDDEGEEGDIEVKVTCSDTGITHILKTSSESKYKEFIDAVMTKAGVQSSSAQQYILCVTDKDGDKIVLDNAKTYRKVMNEFCDSEEAFLRVVVQPASSSILVTAPAPSGPAASTRQGSDVGTSSVFGSNMPAAQQQRRSSDFGLSHCSLDAGDSGKRTMWRKMGLLGKGSFGSVYEGITTDGRLMAVKQIILPADKAQDHAEVDAMMREINLMRSMEHKNIVAYFGCQSFTNQLGELVLEIFLEHCHGGSVNSLRRKFDRVNGRLSISLVRSYTKQVLEGLEYLHAKNVMHRDIKGDNVLISATGEAKLADFGCSKKVGTGTAAEVLTNTMVGTPLWMAPEVVDSQGIGYSNAADIWSVGCFVIELFGKKPWIVQGSALQAMFMICSSKQLPNGVPKGCPPDLQDFFCKCFERDMSKRPSAKQLLCHRWITCPESDLQEPEEFANQPTSEEHKTDSI